MLTAKIGEMEIKFTNTDDLKKQLNDKLVVLNKQNGEILAKAKVLKKQISQINKALKDLEPSKAPTASN